MVDRIKSLCKTNGVTFSEVEKDLNFANGSLAKTNEKTQVSRIARIAAYFNVTMDYLLTGSNSPENTISDRERMILALYRKLNATGKNEAFKRISELAELTQYTEKKEKSSVSKIG